MFSNPGVPLTKPIDGLSREIISKSNNVKNLEPLTIPEPAYVEHCWFPTNLLTIAKAIASQACPDYKKPSFKFVMTSEAAIDNWNLLQKFNNLGEALDSQKGSQLEYMDLNLEIQSHSIISLQNTLSGIASNHNFP